MPSLPTTKGKPLSNRRVAKARQVDPAKVVPAARAMMAGAMTDPVVTARATVDLVPTALRVADLVDPMAVDLGVPMEGVLVVSGADPMVLATAARALADRMAVQAVVLVAPADLAAPMVVVVMAPALAAQADLEVPVDPTALVVAAPVVVQVPTDPADLVVREAPVELNSGSIKLTRSSTKSSARSSR